tara:strand:+ start:6517 stop:6669 length:153 start_codon:yes stop_codon:yes gene_type:complete
MALDYFLGHPQWWLVVFSPLPLVVAVEICVIHFDVVVQQFINLVEPLWKC